MSLALVVSVAGRFLHGTCPFFIAAHTPDI
jgi:hypothetical protein